MVEEFKCTACQRWLPLMAFPKDRTRPRGHSSQCGKCKGDARKAWREGMRAATRVVAMATAKTPLERDREQTLAACKQWRGPVTAGPLVPALGMPVVGMREAYEQAA